MRVHLLSTAVAPLGSGLGGGVEHMVVSAARQLRALGHVVDVIAPVGSKVEGAELRCVPGLLAPTAMALAYHDPLPVEADAFLSAALRDLAERARPDDAILNFSYDWLPLFLSDFLACPMGTLVSVSSVNRSLDAEIRRLSQRHPVRLAFLSAAQRGSFGLVGETVRLIPPGLDVSRYPYNARPDGDWCWLGRIAPEKGLDDVFEFSARTGRPVTVFGPMQERVYWEALARRHPDVAVRYGGFLRMPDLAEALGRFRALLMTPKRLEAFGIVGIEAMACGTPVVAYRRGGPCDYVLDGETGWLVEPDNVDELAAAVERVERIDRARCRNLVESRYALAHYGAALERWLGELSELPAHPAGARA